MTEVLLFHHAQGLTPGIRAIADELRAGGHSVHTPDLYDGKTFGELEEGVAHAQQIGFDTITNRGEEAAARLPSGLVYVGFSLGAVPAQKLAQTRSGATGALLCCATCPPSEFGVPWPERVPLQMHMMDDDEWVAEDLRVARELAETVDGAELFLYPGNRHLFADHSLPSYDEGAATLLKQRALSFLDQLG